MGKKACVKASDQEDTGQKAVMEEVETKRQDGPAPWSLRRGLWTHLCSLCWRVGGKGKGGLGCGQTWSRSIRFPGACVSPGGQRPSVSPRKLPIPLTQGLFSRLTSCRAGVCPQDELTAYQSRRYGCP